MLNQPNIGTGATQLRRGLAKSFKTRHPSFLKGSEMNEDPGRRHSCSIPLQTERLLLRRFDTLDTDRLIVIAGDRRIADATISVPHPFGAEEARIWLDEVAHSPGCFAIALQPDGDTLIGYAGLRHVEAEHRQGELSFWLGAKFEGRGYAGEAAQAVVDFGFRTLGLNRICAYHMVRNPASGRLLARIGFHHEGRLRQRVQKWGKFEDVELWAILQGDHSR